MIEGYLVGSGQDFRTKKRKKVRVYWLKTVLTESDPRHRSERRVPER